MNIIGKINKLSGQFGEFLVSGRDLIKKLSDREQPVFIKLDGNHIPFFIESIISIGKEKFIVKLEAVNTEKKAARFLGKELFSNSVENEMQDGFELNDLIGYIVVDTNHGEIGKVISVDESPKNPLLVIAHIKGEIIFPFADDLILSIDPEAGEIQVTAPDGLLEVYIGNEE